MQATEELSTARFHDTPLQRSWDRRLVHGVFFAGFWASVWFLIRPRVIYDAFGIYLPCPAFSLDGACLREALSRVAGPLEYVSAFLSQWFSVSHVGALIVTAAAGLICAGTERLVRDMNQTRGWFPSLLPALAVLVLYQAWFWRRPSRQSICSCEHRTARNASRWCTSRVSCSGTRCCMRLAKCRIPATTVFPATS